MRWRRLRTDEIDHERLWLFVTLGAAALGFLWLRLGLPTPKCIWHELTGWPCVGCGGTRCVKSALAGDLAGAFLMNPLIFCGLAAVAVFDLYALAVVALNLPRWRIETWPRWLPLSLRVAIAGVLVANWAWLIAIRR